MEKPKLIKHVIDRFSLEGWPTFADGVKEYEAEASARRASRECEVEEAQRLGSFTLDHLRSLPYLPGNQFVEGGRELIPNPEQSPSVRQD